MVHHIGSESQMQSKQWKHPGSSPSKEFKREGDGLNILG